MNDNILVLVIDLSAFFAMAFIVYMLCPKDLTAFKAVILSQRGKKSGLLLLISPFLITVGELIKKIPFSFIKTYLKKVQRWLVSAELEVMFAPEEFAATQLLLPAALYPFLILAAFKIPSFAIFKDSGPAFAAFAGILILGLALPVIILKDKISRRQKSISRELPFALDMLTSAVQAGLDFSGAIRRYIQKASKVTHLKIEFSLMLKEISLGKTRSDSLRRMAERVDLKELTTVVNALIQADQLGTSLGVVLTTLSDDLRIKRFQLAEKLALEAPVKMLFPLVAFIFPSVFIVLIGPLMIQMMNELAKK